jgi:hypothetical protein
MSYNRILKKKAKFQCKRGIKEIPEKVNRIEKEQYDEKGPIFSLFLLHNTGNFIHF